MGVKDVMAGAGIKVNPPDKSVPPGVVTDTFPEVPVATTAEICVEEFTVKEVAAVPPKLTAVAPEKFVPMIVTVAPLAAPDGVNDVMVGAGMKVNPASKPVPPGVITDTFPEDPLATTAEICVEEFTVKEEAAVPPKLTAVAPEKFVPVIVTVAPLAALLGVKDVMAGAGMKVNPACKSVPPGVVTDTFPEVPVATTAEICVEEFTVKEVAAVPPKLTAVAPEKFVPVIVTVAPLAALVGVKDVMLGAGMKVNPASKSVPPGVVTDTFPEVPLATIAMI